VIVCVGLATRDTIYAVPRLPERDGRIVVEEHVTAGGGPAATAAVAAARLGADVRFVGVIDEDLPDVETLRMPGRMVNSTILVLPDGSRSIVTEPWNRFECPEEAVSDADWVHVDHVGYGAVSGPHRLSVDGGNTVPNLDLSRVELYAPSHDDGRRAKITVVTRGADGCTAYVDGERFDVPGYPVDVVSTLGAGDVFHGSLVACLDRGLELREALAKANAAAALSCRALDGRSAIPTWEELP
jgi:sugar/nucleoside kinase (ribokinase family)